MLDRGYQKQERKERKKIIYIYNFFFSGLTKPQAQQPCFWICYEVEVERSVCVCGGHSEKDSLPIFFKGLLEDPTKTAAIKLLNTRSTFTRNWRRSKTFSSPPVYPGFLGVFPPLCQKSGVIENKDLEFFKNGIHRTQE